ncbi:MAG: phosphoribosyltransferase [Bacteroidales bacterium]|jgi:phosphoribosylpyrophosphate synthetase|nr:phosphoribosyltransferase [Bacteroidales bacterium]
MENFIIQPTSQIVVDNKTNQTMSAQVLSHRVTAFYHADYQGGSSEQRETSGTVENVICTLKNQFQDKTPNVLQVASQQLANILLQDLPQILRRVGKNTLTVCVIPRAKVNYSSNQRLFNTTVSNVVNRLAYFHNGTNYIIRHTDTRTTHMNRSGYGGEGEMPYPGITKDTCTISDEVRGKDILLIDDLYTKTVNIDEDAIQALFDKGANSVVFYSVGKTVSK